MNYIWGEFWESGFFIDFLMIKSGIIDEIDPKSIKTIPIIMLNGIASWRSIDARIGASIGLKKNTREVVWSEVSSIALK